MTKKLLLSLLTIGIVSAAAGSATVAYFTSVKEIKGNTITTGTLEFTGVIQDENGTEATFSQPNLAPGQSFVRCLWIKNNGTVPGRYKVYASSESGSTDLGNGLKISAKLNPTEGVCADNSNPFSGSNKYGPDDLEKPSWQNVPLRGNFMSSANTPFKILYDETAMPANYYSLFEVTVTLDADSTIQGQSYVQDIAIYGMQEEGSNTSAW